MNELRVLNVWVRKAVSCLCSSVNGLNGFLPLHKYLLSFCIVECLPISLNWVCILIWISLCFVLFFHPFGWSKSLYGKIYAFIKPYLHSWIREFNSQQKSTLSFFHHLLHSRSIQLVFLLAFSIFSTSMWNVTFATFHSDNFLILSHSFLWNSENCKV